MRCWEPEAPKIAWEECEFGLRGAASALPLPLPLPLHEDHHPNRQATVNRRSDPSHLLPAGPWK